MNKHGEFIWYELLTSDDAAALDFYGAVVGWTSSVFDAGGRPYHILAASDADVGGLMQIPAEAAAGGMTPRWLGYVGVDDVDASVADIIAAGGAVHMPPTDLPGVGRMAMLTDPQGAMFYVMRGAVEGDSKAFSQDGVGHCNWNELSTSDPVAALPFYSARFGWEKGDAMPMGEMGDYRFINHGGRMIGALMQTSPDNPATAWRFYFGVDDIDRASAAVTAEGGRVLYGPAEIPGGGFMVVGLDPQGATFGLVGPRKS